MSRKLIKAARLYDGESTHCNEHMFVILDGDSIEAMGSQNELGQDLDARFDEIIDFDQHSTVLPGLINMHTHMSFSGGDRVFYDAVHDSDPVRMIRITQNLQTALMSGVTTVRDCGTLPHLALPVRDAIDTGLMPGPRVITSGAITTTGGHCWYCATEADDEASVRTAVRNHAKDGVDFIKLFATGGNLTPGTNSLAAQFSEHELCAATEEARRLGKRSASHAHGTPGVINSIKARVTTIEHCSFLNENGIGWDETLARQVGDLGIYVCHTIFQGPAKYENDDNFELTESDIQQRDTARERLDLTRRLADAGVQLIAGNDAGVSHVGFGDFPRDLVLVADGCGFSAVDVLRSALSVAADALGLDTVGRLRPGAVADFLAVRGDPTADINAITQTQWIMARGNTIVSNR